MVFVHRLYFTTRPMEDGLAEAVDDGKVGPRDEPKARGKVLCDDFGWDKDLAKKIWCVTSCRTTPPPFHLHLNPLHWVRPFSRQDTDKHD